MLFHHCLTILISSDFQSHYKNYKWRRTPIQLLQELCICNGTFVFHLSVCLNCISSLIYISHLPSNLEHTDAVSLAIIHMTLCDFIWHYIKVNHNLVNGNKHQGGSVLLWMKTNEGREMQWLCTLWRKRGCLNGLKSTYVDIMTSLTHSWD